MTYSIETIKDKNLLSLPVLPRYRDACEDIISDAYKADIAAIETVEQLHAHVKKWENMFLLRCPRRSDEDSKLEPVSVALLNGDFSAEEVLYFLAHKKDNDIDMENHNAQVMANIVLPFALIDAFTLAHHYGVGIDLGFIRFFLDGYPELDEALR